MSTSQRNRNGMSFMPGTKPVWQRKRRTSTGASGKQWRKETDAAMEKELESWLLEQISKPKLSGGNWREGWKPLTFSATNLLTRKRYRNSNQMLLTMARDNLGYGTSWWMTYRQALELGGHVRKGEKGCLILFFQMKEMKDPDTGETTLKPCRRYSTVFNWDQVENIEKPEDVVRLFGEEGMDENVQKIIDHHSVGIGHNPERAFYHRTMDKIMMPDRAQFPDDWKYYNTLLHEMGHWTGHKDRLDRKSLYLAMEYGELSKDYAFEEITVEVASMVIADALGIRYCPNTTAKYVHSWAQPLSKGRGTKNYSINKACTEAQKIRDYLLDPVGL